MDNQTTDQAIKSNNQSINQSIKSNNQSIIVLAERPEPIKQLHALMFFGKGSKKVVFFFGFKENEEKRRARFLSSNKPRMKNSKNKNFQRRQPDTLHAC